MTPQEINMAIAKVCGWSLIEHDDGLWSAVDADGHLARRKCGISKEHAEAVCFDNYYGDLNAMHEAEKTCLRPTPSDNAMQRDEKFVRWDNYTEFLAVKMGRDDAPHATAAQRAEAFLRTLGLWEVKR